MVGTTHGAENQTLFVLPPRDIDSPAVNVNVYVGGSDSVSVNVEATNRCANNE